MTDNNARWDEEAIEAKISEIEDGGATQNAEQLRALLEGTEELMDTHPRIGYYWGCLHTLDMMELMQAA